MLIQKGQDYYLNGIPAKSIAACVGCHGDKAQGTPSFAPRLAGQHAPYLVKQLQAFRAGLRKEAQTMPGIVSNIGDDDAQALAAFLQSIN